MFFDQILFDQQFCLENFFLTKEPGPNFLASFLKSGILLLLGYVCDMVGEGEKEICSGLKRMLTSFDDDQRVHVSLIYLVPENLNSNREEYLLLFKFH